jgi:hypothetical protein
MGATLISAVEAAVQRRSCQNVLGQPRDGTHDGIHLDIVNSFPLRIKCLDKKTSFKVCGA